MIQPKYGMTGTRTATPLLYKTVRAWVMSLPDDAIIYHGACEGADALVAEAAKERGLYVIAVVPHNKKAVDYNSVRNSDERIDAPKGMNGKNDYRVRNELLVSQVDFMHAFWTGKKRYSGTFMTMNIARKTNVPLTYDMV